MHSSMFGMANLCYPQSLDVRCCARRYGLALDHLTNDSILVCCDNVPAIAPDGHDAMNDPAREVQLRVVLGPWPAKDDRDKLVEG